MTSVSDLRFVGLGGTDEVRASSYLYLLTEGNLLIDAGVRPGGVGEAALPKFEGSSWVSGSWVESGRLGDHELASLAGRRQVF
jgi:predicted metal-dependent RNase